MKEVRQGEQISKEELEQQGWRYVSGFGLSSLIFKNGKDCIIWESKSQEIVHRYSVSE